MLGAVLAGFALGGSLIIAIGAQNAFVIRQGVLNQFVFWICLFCSLSDAVLIWGGTYGLAGVLKAVPALLPVMRYGGAAFLLWYGVKAFLRALHPEAMGESRNETQSLQSALALCAAFTWLNPHVYLDTVVLVGSIANARAAGEQAPFALGASLASLVWFFGLGYGAKALRDVLSRPSVWRGIDFAIAAIMFWLALKLLMGG
ncbi:MAG: amino acid transporter [Alphaproteobacteria bacterium]|nr:amino acid transporter [Alphaproteobacteria bacterium]